MMRLKLFFAVAMMMVLLLFGKALAQDPLAKNDNPDSLSVTASLSNQRLRFTASSVTQMRLEVYSSTGIKLFDTELRGGNVLDWLLLDGQARPLADDSYLCVVTVKSLSGRLTQRLGSLLIEQHAAKLLAPAPSQMTPQQLDAIGPVEENAFFTPLEADDQRPATVVAHDGTDGLITRGKGALTFRLGDFFSATDTEQMRLTAEGNLGIGTSSPQARLDVAGTIRATGGILFPDGSIQYSAASKTFGTRSSRPSQASSSQGGVGTQALDISGSGTTGKLALWLDGPNGVLGDANIMGVSGALGINGSPDTRFRLDVNGSTRIRGSNPGFLLEGLRAAGNIWLFQTVDDDGRFRLFSQDSNNPGLERLTIKLDTGNLGIGTTTPTAKLDVAGAINTSSQYNIGGQRVLKTAGTNNLFVGIDAGAVIFGTGTENTFVGSSAGFNNSSGNGNTFIGKEAGLSNTTASFNTFVGKEAGLSNTTASFNTFVGRKAGFDNTTGAGNTFFGESAGSNNTTANFNTFVGTNAGNSNTTGGTNTFVGTGAGMNNTTGSINTFFGENAGSSNTTGNFNTFVGAGTGLHNTTGVNNTIIGNSADVASGNLTFATAIGAGAVISDSNSVVLGRADGSDTVRIPGPVLIDGSLVVHTLSSAGSTQLCLNAADRLAPCSSSLRYKSNVQSFFGGLEIVRRLRPIIFDWKDGGMRDVGFGAEEVEKVEPLLTIRNKKGEIEGVKYGQISAVLVNAVNEQQAQIEQYRKQFAAQQSELKVLKQLLCRNHAKAAVCQSARRLKR